MEQLKPCPFCGGEPIRSKSTWIVRGEERFVYEISCLGCGCDKKGYDEDSVYRKWNIRTDTDRENAILRRMVEIAAEYAYCPPVATTKAETMKAFMDQWRKQAEKELAICSPAE